MATLYITEFAMMGKDGANDVIPCAQLTPTVPTQTIALSSTSGQSAALNAQTKYVRVMSDTACFILSGTNPVALTTSMPLPSNTPEYFGIPGGITLKIAGITA